MTNTWCRRRTRGKNQDTAEDYVCLYLILKYYGFNRHQISSMQSELGSGVGWLPWPGPRGSPKSHPVWNNELRWDSLSWYQHPAIPGHDHDVIHQPFGMAWVPFVGAGKTTCRGPKCLREETHQKMEFPMVPWKRWDRQQKIIHPIGNM